MAVIQLANVYKSFLADRHPSITRILLKRASRVQVLKDISLQVNHGEILGVIGRNGVGKSTLLRLIGGVYEKDSGRLFTEGDIVSIFELGSFFNTEISGERYCRDYFSFRGIKGKRRDQLIKSVHEFTELGNYFFQPIKYYSSGMQARLLFGAATALPAKIILIDEFLVVGDEYFRGKAWDRLRRFVAAGTTGIIVSHDWTALMKLCRRAMVLNPQGIEFVGPSYEAVQQYLKIPYSESSEITFRNKDAMIKHPIHVRPGQDFQYSFIIEVLDDFSDNNFAAGFSIERYTEGVGWSLAMTGMGTIEINGRRLIEVSITINNLCLAPGEYLLCLFLCRPVKPGQKSSEKVYESLTWLNGRPIRLVVEGKNPTGQILSRSFIWTIKH